MSEDTEDLVEADPAEPPAPPHLAVRIVDHDYALPITHVCEVMRVAAITRVPHAPARMRGLTTVRGRVVPVVDPAVSLGGPPTSLDDDARLVVVSSGPRLIGMLVSRIGGVVAGTGGAEPLDVDAIAEAS